MNPRLPALFDPAADTDVLRASVSVWPRDGGGDVLERAAAHARDLIQNDRAQSSREKYASCWTQFVRWLGTDERLRQQSEVPAHPTVVALYVGSLRERHLTKATILVHLAAIAYAHELLGFPAPWHASAELKSEMRDLRRAHDDDRQSREAIEREFATEVLLRLPEARTLTQFRDHAVFCLGWLSALRRSNIAALRRRDVVLLIDPKDETRYLELFVRRSKTDQEGRGRHLVITELPGTHPLCAIRALEAWFAVAQIAPDDPLFQTVTFTRRETDRRLTGKAIQPGDVARVVKRIIEQAGLDPSMYAAHSLRRGFATTMQNAGIRDAVAMEHGGWKSKDTYYRYNRVNKTRDNAIRELFG